MSTESTKDETKDRRPEVARDGHPDAPEKAQEKWHAAEETLGEAAATGPNAEKRSRVSGG